MSLLKRLQNVSSGGETRRFFFFSNCFKIQLLKVCALSTKGSGQSVTQNFKWNGNFDKPNIFKSMLDQDKNSSSSVFIGMGVMCWCYHHRRGSDGEQRVRQEGFGKLHWFLLKLNDGSLKSRCTSTENLHSINMRGVMGWVRLNLRDGNDKMKGQVERWKQSKVPMEIFGKLLLKNKDENKCTYIFIFLFIFHFWEDTLYTKYPIGS